jgi:anti-sigma factor RsiW
VEFVELVTDYLEGALDAGQRAALEHHMTYCGPCVTYLQQYRAAIDAAASLRETAGEIPDPVLYRLVQAFRDSDRGDGPAG